MHPRLKLQVKEAQVFLQTYDNQETPPSVDLIIASKRPYLVEDIINNINRQTVRFNKLIFIPQGYSEEQVEQFRSTVTNTDKLHIYTLDDSIYVGGRYNDAVRNHSESSIIMHMDDDDLYYPNYAKSMIGCHLHTKRELVSKSDYLQQDITNQHIDFAHTYKPRPNTHIGLGCTLLYTRNLFDSLKGFNDTFPMGYEGYLFYKAAKHGFLLGQCDSFNFLYRRGYGDHTWVANITVKQNTVFENELIL